MKIVLSNLKLIARSNFLFIVPQVFQCKTDDPRANRAHDIERKEPAEQAARDEVEKKKRKKGVRTSERNRRG